MLISLVLNRLSHYHQKRCQHLLQTSGMTIYGAIHRILSEAGISYFADHGTLLGLIRENGVIPHDTDMDFSIPPDESLTRVYRALSCAGFRLGHGFSCCGKIAEITFAYKGLTVDFFQCHNIGEKLGHYVFVTRYDHKTGAFLGTMAHERIRPALAGLETREFGTEIKATVSIPSNAVEYLTASYGNWRVPDSKTDFSSDKIPTQYRDILEGCKLLSADEIVAEFSPAGCQSPECDQRRRADRA